MRALLILAVTLVAVDCARSGEQPGGDWFVDRAEQAGLDFVHFTGASGGFYPPEIFAPGVALLDYDNDGDLDIFVLPGRMLGSASIHDALFPPRGPMPLEGRLYRNDLEVRADGTRVLHFTDVTETSGIRARAYGMGVAAARRMRDTLALLRACHTVPSAMET